MDTTHFVSRYTSGEVKFWNPEAGEDCVFQPSCRALEINEDAEEGTSANYVTSVATNQSVTVAGYSQGNFAMEQSPSVVLLCTRCHFELAQELSGGQKTCR